MEVGRFAGRERGRGKLLGTRLRLAAALHVNYMQVEYAETILCIGEKSCGVSAPLTGDEMIKPRIETTDDC